MLTVYFLSILVTYLFLSLQLDRCTAVTLTFAVFIHSFSGLEQIRRDQSSKLIVPIKPSSNQSEARCVIVAVGFSFLSWQ